MAATVIWRPRLKPLGAMSGLSGMSGFSVSSGAAGPAILLETAGVSTGNLSGHWRLDEIGATTSDAHGTNTLTNNVSVAETIGKIGQAAAFNGSNYLSIGDNASLSTGNIDFTWAGWVYFNTLASSHLIAAKGASGSTTREWILRYDNGTNRIVGLISSDGASASVTVTANNFGAPSTDTWYFIIFWHDASADTLNIQVNDGTVDSTATAGVAPVDRAGDFELASATGDTLNDRLNGRLDSVSFWKRVLSSGERSQLYNSGSGLDYPLTISSGYVLQEDGTPILLE